MIETLRSRGRLVELIAASPERAIAESVARHAINELEPTPDELRWMINYLATYCPRAAYEAATHCREIYRDAPARAIRNAPAGSAHGAPDFRDE